MKKIIFFLRNIFLVILFIIIQINFIFLFPYPFNQWQIYLSFLIIFLVLFPENNQIIWWGIFFTIFLSFFTIYPFFIMPLLFIGLFFLIDFIIKNFITTKTWQSIFILSFLITFLYNFLLFFILYFFNYFYFSTSNVLLIKTFFNIFWQIIFNFLGALLFFLFSKLRYY